jgi:hypothetical protein
VASFGAGRIDLIPSVEAWIGHFRANGHEGTGTSAAFIVLDL